MNGYPATPCPWGRSKLTLDIKELKPSEKEWLGREVASGRQTAAKLANTYGLKAKSIQNYVDKVREGSQFHRNKGRPNIVSPAVKIKPFNI
jgi:hypothetical protein